MRDPRAKFIGVGVGPGDPELITLKAARLIRQADVVAYIANEQGESQSKAIASDLLGDADSTDVMAGKVLSSQSLLPIIMPMCDDRSMANNVYDQAAEQIIELINQGKQVVFLCEGDPLFFGSFAYLLERLQERKVSCDVVPGISSVHAASSVLQQPLTLLQESFAVMSGRHSLEQLVDGLRAYDSVVIMKAGRSRQKIIAALESAGRRADAKYLEYIGRDNEMVYHDINHLEDEVGPYFSLFVVLPSTRSANDVRGSM